MSLPDFLDYLISVIEAVGVPYMVSGSVASGYHGEPRATYDIDIVIDGDWEVVSPLVRKLSGRCYVTEATAQEATNRRTMFNVIDLDTGSKADLILRKDRPYSVEEFVRRRKAVISGVNLNVVSVEDCILSKLEWSNKGASERLFADAEKMVRVARDKLDVDYLRTWANELGVSDLLERLLIDD